MINRYVTVEKDFAQASFTEKKSEFIGYAARVESEEQAKSFIERIRREHSDATHNCYAYLLKDSGLSRFSDDGEPGGTAGMPMLEVIKREGVCDVCIVVTRYFGGILLGAGGLVRAYSGAARLAVEAAEFVSVSRCVDICVHIDYPLYERVARLASDCGAKTLDTRFTHEVEIDLRMLDGTQQPLLDALRELTRGACTPAVTDPFDAVF